MLSRGIECSKALVSPLSACWLAVAAVLGAALSGCSGSDAFPQDFDAAKALAARRGVPVLLDFSTTWCGPCQAFANDLQGDPELRDGIHRRVVFLPLDADKDEGQQLVRRFPVRAYPTFVLVDPRGAYLAHFAGYGGKATFLQRVDAVLAGAVPLEERRARFGRAPTARDAEALAAYARDTGDDEAATALLRRAEQLGGASGPYAEFERALRRLDESDFGRITADEKKRDALYRERLAAASDAVLAALASPTLDAERKVRLALQLVDRSTVSRWYGTAPEQASLLRGVVAAAAAAVAATGGKGVDPELAEELQLQVLLRVTRDADGALALRQQWLGEGWEKDRDRLLALAMFCLDEEIALDRAAGFAQAAADMSPPGWKRAAALSTLAEIEGARGHRGLAIATARRALAEDPGNEGLVFVEKRVRGELR